MTKSPAKLFKFIYLNMRTVLFPWLIIFYFDILLQSHHIIYDVRKVRKK